MFILKVFQNYMVYLNILIHLHLILSFCYIYILLKFSNPELYRLFNLDVFEYEINNRMALYGAVPFVQAHRYKN